MAKYLNLKPSDSKGRQFADEFEGALENLLKQLELPAGAAVLLISNLNFHNQPIPADIFSRINYKGKFNKEDRDVLKEVFGTIEEGVCRIDRPERISLGDSVFQYNFIRGFRPRRNAALSDVALNLPIEYENGKPKGFHYGLSGIEKEIFSSKEMNGLKVDFLFNKYPFAPGHFLFVPDRMPKLNPATGNNEIHNQYLDSKSEKDREILRAAWDFITSGEYGDSVRLAYNSQGAHASANHLHFQGFFITQDWEPPIEKILRAKNIEKELNDYFPGFVWIPKSEGVEKLISFIRQYNDEWQIREKAGKSLGENIAYNFYLTPKGAVFFPRKHQGNEKYFGTLKECQFSTGYAFFETLGEIICPSKDIFSLDNGKITGIADKVKTQEQARSLYSALNLETSVQ